jgi:hypothetical protein
MAYLQWVALSSTYLANCTYSGMLQQAWPAAWKGQHLSGSLSIRIRETHAEKGASDSCYLLAGTLRGSGEQQIGPRVRDAAIRCQDGGKVLGTYYYRLLAALDRYACSELHCSHTSLAGNRPSGARTAPERIGYGHPASEPAFQPLSCGTWAVRHTARFTYCTNHA